MNQKEKSQLIDEFRILKSLVHPNIVQYYHHEHVAEEHAVHLYMEYCGGGDLAGVIQTCKATGEYVPEAMVWSVFTQLTLALYRCHFNSDPPPPGELFSSNDYVNPPQPATVILHRDIKPDNVFLDQFNSVKLGDFGLAKILDQDHFMANTYVGTPYYMSPEVLLDKPFTPQSDIWSLGCVIYELCAKHPPFQAKTHLQLSQKIREGSFPPLPSTYSPTLSKTIAACLNMNYLQRPTTATLLRLDIMKLCRKEREVTEAQKEIQELREQILLERENMMNQLQIQQEQQQMQIIQQISEEFNLQLEQEVQQRVTAILQEQNMNMQNQNQNQGSRHNSPERKPVSWGNSDVPFSNNSSPIYYKQPFTAAMLCSPSDVVMTSAQNTPMPSRNVKGPRTIRDNSVSPLFNSRSPGKSLHFEDESPSFKSSLAQRNRKLATKSNSTRTESSKTSTNLLNYETKSSDDDLGNNFTLHKYSSEDISSTSSASVSTYSSQSSQFSASSELSHSSYDMDQHFGYSQNAATPKKTSVSPQSSSTSVPTTPRERQAPHFQAVYEAKKSIVTGVRAATAMAKVMGIKGPTGAIGRRVVQIQRDTNNPTIPMWDEHEYGDEMPSPFLKRGENWH